MPLVRGNCLIRGAVAAGEVVRIVRVREEQAHELELDMIGEVAIESDAENERVLAWVRPPRADPDQRQVGLVFYRDQLERVSVNELRVLLLACLGLRYFLQVLVGEDGRVPPLPKPPLPEWLGPPRWGSSVQR